MSISILGCGWLGLPLGKILAQQGHLVKGSTTSPNKCPMLADAGIQPFVLRLAPQPEGELGLFLESCQTLIVCIPPRAGLLGDSFHVEQIQALCQALSATSVSAVLYVSSTSVYPDTNELMTESSDVLTTSPLVQAERLLARTGIPLTIVRFGGLMGAERIPGKYFIGKTVSTGQIPVNFIHQTDAVGVLAHLVNQKYWGATFNAVAPLHPIRKDIYLRNAAEFGWQPPIFVEDSEPIPYKIVSPEKLITQAAYEFIYPNPLEFPYSIQR